MKITQYCSVCREELEMEVVPTEDEEVDGVIWLRCPGCRGFLPKIGAAFADESGRRAGAAEGRAGAAPDPAADPAGAAADPGESGSADVEAGAWRAPASRDAPAAPGEQEQGLDDQGLEDDEDEEPEAALGRPGRKPAAAPPVPAEPLDEYAALLADADLEAARPYRPWDAYEVGDVVHHLAWGDFGVVVAKESLPGGRKAVKVYFDQAGVVRLIENADVEP